MTASEHRNYQAAILFSIILHLSLLLIVFPMQLFSVPAGVEEVAVGMYEFSGTEPQIAAPVPEPEVAIKPELQPKPVSLQPKPAIQPKPTIQPNPKPQNGQSSQDIKPNGNLPKAPVSFGAGAGMVIGFGTAPYYPKNALNEEVEGEALIRALIKNDGALEQVDLVKSSGDPRLDRAAVNSLKREWVFKPNTEDYYIDIAFTFSLKSGVEYKLINSATRP